MKKISFRDDILPLKNKLYRLALRITLDTAESEDIVQDTMIKIWSKKDELSEIDSIEAFCLRACRNLALDRKEKKEAQNVELNETTISPTDNSRGADEQMAQDERRKIVYQLLNSLPETQRSAMQLRDIEGKTYKEIADILNMTEENVKITLFRARQRIRREYEKIDNYGL